MSVKTAYWTWPRLDDGPKQIAITKDHLQFIRQCAVWWDGAENGAAGLTDADLLELGNDYDTQSLATEIFLNFANLTNFKGKIKNPFYGRASDDEDMDYCLSGVPDQDIADLLRTGDDFEFEASKDEIKIWQAANKRAAGIDPKRPIETTAVARDMREILDPNKDKFTTKEFTKYRRHIESRMMLLLLFFVQNAELEAANYVYRDYEWQQTDEDMSSGEAVGKQEWVNRVWLLNAYDCQAYTKTARALQHLVWENRISNSYKGFVEQLKLDNLYGEEARQRYGVDGEVILLAGLEGFSDSNVDIEKKWLTAFLVRAYNAQGRFEDAQQWLQKSDVFEVDKEAVDYAEISLALCFFLEGIIARRGLDIISEADFQKVIDDTNADWRTPHRRRLWDFVWNILHDPQKYKEPEKHAAFDAAQAIAAQLQLMRGGYTPS